MLIHSHCVVVSSHCFLEKKACSMFSIWLTHHKWYTTSRTSPLTVRCSRDDAIFYLIRNVILNNDAVKSHQDYAREKDIKLPINDFFSLNIAITA